MSALKDKIAGLKFPAEVEGVACPFAGQSLFEAVKVFDLQDLSAAFAELLVFKARAAFLVLTEERQHTQRMGSALVTSFHEDFAIMLSDRNYKDRQLAMTGDSTTPGVLLISDVLVESLAGEFSPGLVAEMGGGELFAIDGEDRTNQIGRIGWRQDLTLHGGRLERALSRQALITYAPQGA